MIAVFRATTPYCLALAASLPTFGSALGQTPPAPLGAPVPLLVPPPPTLLAPPQLAHVPEMMTATPEYCATLGGRVGTMARETKVTAEAADLVREGQRLCEDGKTRSGVQHLRRAFILMRQPEGER